MIKKKTIKYLCVDTNIFIQCCLLEIEGDNLDVLNKLHHLLDKDKLRLLLPEVIKLEFYKVLGSKLDSLTESIGRHKKAINMDTFDKKIKEDLLAKLDEVTKDRKEISKKVQGEIEAIFDHKNTIQTGLELTPQIFVEAYKTSLSGNKPFKKMPGELNLFQQDCLIIESLRTYFKTLSGYEFYFCSQNKEDFAEKDKADNLNTHKDIKKGFKHVTYYENLGKLLNKEFKSGINKKTIQKLEDEKISLSLSGASTVAPQPPDYFFLGDSNQGGERLSDSLAEESK